MKKFILLGLISLALLQLCWTDKIVVIANSSADSNASANVTGKGKGSVSANASSSSNANANVSGNGGGSASANSSSSSNANANVNGKGGGSASANSSSSSSANANVNGNGGGSASANSSSSSNANANVNGNGGGSASANSSASSSASATVTGNNHGGSGGNGHGSGNGHGNGADCLSIVNQIEEIKNRRYIQEPSPQEQAQTAKQLKKLYQQYDDNNCDQYFANQQKKSSCVRTGCHQMTCASSPLPPKPCTMMLMIGSECFTPDTYCGNFNDDGTCGFVYPPKYWDCVEAAQNQVNNP